MKVLSIIAQEKWAMHEINSHHTIALDFSKYTR